MSLDDIANNFQSNLPTITFFFGILTILIRLALKKSKDSINITVKDSESRICNQVSEVKNNITTEIDDVKNQINNLKDDVERHERWFESFFGKYIKSMTDINYRNSVRKTEGENNEFS